MRKIGCFLIGITVLISCEKESDLGSYDTTSDFLNFTFNEKKINHKGFILFEATDIESVYSNGLSRKCPGYSLDFNDDNTALIYMTIPAFSTDLNDNIIEKKYFLEGGGCSETHRGEKFFGLDLKMNLDNKAYTSEFDNDTTTFYNRIKEIEYIGTYRNDSLKDVFKIKGEFSIDIIDKNANPLEVYKIRDGRYKVTLITHK